MISRFRTGLDIERDRPIKGNDCSIVQLLFTFIVMLSENNYILEKYSASLLEIVVEHLEWAIANKSSSCIFIINICNILLSVRETACCQQ